MTAFRVVALAAVVGAASALLFPAFLALRSMDTKVFEPQPFDYALLGASMFAISLGAQLVPWVAHRYVAVLAVLAAGFLLFGLLAAFSLGLAFVPSGIVLLLLLYRALRRSQRSRRVTRAALGGAAIGFGLPLLWIALIVPPTVECFANGSGTSSGRWRGASQQISASGYSSGDARAIDTGRMEFSDSVVTFRCEGGRIVEFQRTAR